MSPRPLFAREVFITRAAPDRTVQSSHTDRQQYTTALFAAVTVTSTACVAAYYTER